MQKDCRTCKHSKFGYGKYCAKQGCNRIIDETAPNCPFYSQSFLNRLFNGRVEDQIDPRFVELHGGCAPKKEMGND